MPRNNLLKKAFHNNFIRKSFADLKSLTADKADAKLQDGNPKTLRSQYLAAAPMTPSSRTGTLDSPDLQSPVSKKEMIDSDPFVEDLPIRKKLEGALDFESAQNVRFPTPEPPFHEEALDDVDPMAMTSSQVRQLMDKVRNSTVTCWRPHNTHRICRNTKSSKPVSNPFWPTNRLPPPPRAHPSPMSHLFSTSLCPTATSFTPLLKLCSWRTSILLRGPKRY